MPALEAPLAVCDAQSLRSQDMMETDLRYPDRTGAIYSFSHSPGHRWLYFPAMQPEETLLLKCYDSNLVGARFTAHSAIDDPATPNDAPPPPEHRDPHPRFFRRLTRARGRPVAALWRR